MVGRVADGRGIPPAVMRCTVSPKGARDLGRRAGLGLTITSLRDAGFERAGFRAGLATVPTSFCITAAADNILAARESFVARRIARRRRLNIAVLLCDMRGSW